MPPETQATEDVKQESEPSTDETKKEDKKEEFEGLEESDLNALEEQKSVPYGRFKEKNEEAKLLNERLQTMEQHYKGEVNRAIQDAEIRAHAKFQKEQDTLLAESAIDPMERQNQELTAKISRLEETITSVVDTQSIASARTRISDLETKFPNADTEAVLGWNKLQSRPLEELMEKSHRDNTDRATKLVRNILDAKSKRAEQRGVPVIPTGIRIKPEDKPKDLQEAKRMALKYLG